MICSSQAPSATPEKFENAIFIVKTHQMFSVHATPQKFEKATITGDRKLIVFLRFAERFRKGPFS